MYSITIRRRLLILLLGLLSVIMYFLRFRIPFLPNYFTVEFSTFPELLLTFAFGPSYGVAACLIKNIIHSVVTGNTFVPDMANFIAETAFLLVAGITSPRIREAVRLKNGGVVSNSKRVGVKALSSLLAIITELIIQFALTNIFVYPMLMKNYPFVYTQLTFLQGYNEALDALQRHLPASVSALVPDIKYVWQGVLLINISVSFVKLVVAAVLTMLIYFLILPLIFPKISNKEK